MTATEVSRICTLTHVEDIIMFTESEPNKIQTPANT